METITTVAIQISREGPPSRIQHANKRTARLSVKRLGRPYFVNEDDRVCKSNDVKCLPKHSAEVGLPQLG